MNAHEIKMALADRAESVASYLLPHGKKCGQEWRVGSTDGEEGQSLGVRIAGGKAGVWSDFSTGESGDLIDLWQAVRKIDLASALDEIRDYLGVKPFSFTTPKEKNYTRPSRPECQQAEGELLDYLVNERKLDPETVDAFKVRITSKGEILFPQLRGKELINIKYLKPRKAAGEKNGWRQESDAEPCLFGWQALSTNARSVVITEGEIDCMSVHNAGYPALSIPSGAKNTEWIPTEFDHLERFDDIVLMFDMDEAGQGMVSEVAKRLGLERVRVAQLPLKDANEMLKAGRDDELLQAIADAKPLDPKELKSAKDFEEDVIKAMTGEDESDHGLNFPWSKTHFKIGISPGELSVWTGINGHGKSLLLGYVMLHAIRQGAKVCIFSGEMNPKRTLIRMVRQTVGTETPTVPAIHKAFDFMNDHLWLFDRTGSTTPQQLIDVFTYAHRRYGVNQFVIDSLMKCGIDDDDYVGQKRFMDALCDFKHQHNVHVHLVAHPRKSESEYQTAGKMDVKGSSSIADLADNMYSVWRNKKKEENPDEKADEPDTIFRSIKQRDTDRWEGSLALWFKPGGLQFVDSKGLSACNAL